MWHDPANWRPLSPERGGRSAFDESDTGIKEGEHDRCHEEGHEHHEALRLTEVAPDHLETVLQQPWLLFRCALLLRKIRMKQFKDTWVLSFWFSSHALVDSSWLSRKSCMLGLLCYFLLRYKMALQTCNQVHCFGNIPPNISPNISPGLHVFGLIVCITS